MWQLLGSETEMVLELVSLVSPSPAAQLGAAPSLISDSSSRVPDSLRALAVRVLAVLLQDRTRHPGVISAINGSIGQGGPGLLSNIMRAAVTAYVSSGQPGAVAAMPPPPSAQLLVPGAGPAHAVEHQALTWPSGETYLQVTNTGTAP